MKQINLEKILYDELSDNMMNVIDNNENMKEWILDAMKEACKQVLELATENASAKIEIQWSGNTGTEYCDEYAIVDKQSILNTINQIK